MPQRIFFVLVVLIFLPFGEIMGQQKNVEKISSTPIYSSYLQANNRLYSPAKNSGSFFSKPPVENGKKPCISLWQPPVVFASPKSISPDFYTSNLGFFCRKELQLEKAIAIPFRFRLGSLRYTDYLEGKNRNAGNHGF